MKASRNCWALKCRAVGIKRVYSREPWERTRGRNDACDRGVDMPVCGPEPYMVVVLRRSAVCERVPALKSTSLYGCGMVGEGHNGGGERMKQWRSILPVLEQQV